MRGSAAFRTGVAPGGALAPGWVRDALWRSAQTVPSLDLRFADNKSLTDAVSNSNLVTFTRASSGTYVGSDGVLKTATTNFRTFSDAILTANSFGANLSTLTTVTTATPTASTTASLFTLNAGANTGNNTDGFNYGSSITLTNSTQHTQSLFVKPAGATVLRLRSNVSGSLFDFTLTGNGTAPSISNDLQGAFIVSLANGWYRISWTFTTTTSAPGNRGDYWTIKTNVADGTNGLYVVGAQLEQSSTVGEYIPTTSTINSAPRFDHNPTTGESLGLLVEEQRTNSIRNNTMVGAVAGTPGTAPTNWVFTTAAGITRELVGVGTENGISYIDYRFSGTATGSSDTQFDGSSVIAALSGQSWTSSAYVKLQAGSLANATITQIVAENSAAGGFLAASTQNITPTSSALGQQRASLSRTLNNASTAYVITALRVTSAGAIDITLRIGLPQLEQGAFATSVIPTTGTTATRSADVASITGTNFSSWYRQDEGTVYYDGAVSQGLTAFPWFYNITDGTTNNSIGVYQFTNGIYGSVVTSGVAATPDTSVLFSPVPGSTAKHALAVKALDTRAALNNALASAQLNTVMPVVNALSIGQRVTGNRTNGTIRRLTYWPQRLPNSTLQAITQ